ncbi:MOSC domain-containing protein [Flavisphingomonas formosensis]|uniref:MOSC domain-containing protein n=1 Tax=Flavisphingomonas formosensis TaxID=861534 RepID=UPI0012FC7C5C|nr:MOSC domain-containing protein [Sphingomonas formosensis]
MAGRVVAVSVAQPRWLEIYGRRVFTSIVRDAVAGPIVFAPGGPEGNATAVHTEEVFAFFAEHYDYWSRRLGIDRADWGACHWGENLMLAGMPDEGGLRIGDRFRIGEAILEVTSPRIPCFKLSWRLGQAEGFLQELIASGRMGCYLRVVEPGRIGVDDAVERVSVAHAAISVLGLSQLLHDPDIVDLDILRSVLVTPGLGGQAAGMIRKRLAFLTDGRLQAQGRWQGWRQFAIAHIVDEAKGIKSFHLRPLDDRPIGGYRAGQFLTVRLPEAAGAPTRSWSISDYDPEADSYRLSIKREPDGLASGWMHDHAEIGDVLEVRPPTGRFVLDRSGFLRTVLISAGIGVTPMIAMLKAHAERGMEAPPLLWIHAARSGEEHAFADEANGMLAAIPGSVRRVFYSAPGDGDRAGEGYDRTGRIDAEAIAELIAENYSLSPFGRVIELTGEHSDFYLCGPAPFEDAVRTALVAHGVNPLSIRSESFAPVAAAGDEPPAPEEAQVEFAGQGRHMVWRRDDDLTLLELAEEAGLSVDSACRTGICGTCEAALRAGKVRYLVTPAAEPGEGRVLLCCSQPASPHIVIGTVD